MIADDPQDQEFDVFDRYIDETRNSLFLLSAMLAKPEIVRCVAADSDAHSLACSLLTKINESFLLSVQLELPRLICEPHHHMMHYQELLEQLIARTNDRDELQSLRFV